MSSIERRIEKLESATDFKDESNQLKVVMGYIQHLPPESTGPRHLVIRDRLPWSGLGGCLYEWEEVEGQLRRITRRLGQILCLSS
jgi:hypothetical protein